MFIPTDSRTNIPQDERTNKPIEAKLILNFKLRPADWAGNDCLTVFALNNIMRIIRVILTNTCILRGDETVNFTGEWRRPNESWQKIKIKE